MPDLPNYLQGLGIAAMFSLCAVLGMAALRWLATEYRLNLGSVVLFGIAVLLGFYWLNFSWRWPPLNGLNRFLMIVIPLGLFVEFIGCLFPSHRKWSWCGRLLFAISIPRILLHHSVYLKPADTLWSLPAADQPWAHLYLASGFLLGGIEWLFSRSYLRRCERAVSIALTCSILAGGAVIMFAGYIKGGAAAFPLSGALFGTVGGVFLVTKWKKASMGQISTSINRLGFVVLFSLLFVGITFGKVPPLRGLLLFVTPALVALTELPGVSKSPEWIRKGLQIGLITCSLVLIVLESKREFDAKFVPLIGP